LVRGNHIVQYQQPQWLEQLTATKRHNRNSARTHNYNFEMNVFNWLERNGEYFPPTLIIKMVNENAVFIIKLLLGIN